ncbi:hypothetical protein [Marmoricola sp. URHB0036]|uniref:hypothetical protein n=1 Tax=Marmoricola sp. URHB0036 TaxID=1298863 RepID=UPI0012DECD57|nr:hypothetical protein [Marmoricola sp. URHB0036]
MSSSASVGKYFAVTNAIPSALLVVYVWLLLSVGAWRGPIDVGRLAPALHGFGWQDLAWFIAASLVVALLIHPLQFVFTQVLEGYWGVSRLGRALALAQVKRHHRNAVSLRKARDCSYQDWVVRGERLANATDTAPVAPRGEDWARREKRARRALARPGGRVMLPAYLAQQAYERQLRSYPAKLYRVMPTRLGNVLRRSEDEAGTQYGLETVVIAPHLSLIADPSHYAYVEDRQKAMDLAITMCLVGALATAITAVLFSDDGLWCLFALVPFALAYASYLGVVASAASYNVAIETVTDLSRFALYDALHVTPPTTGGEEFDTARELMALLKGERSPGITFAQREVEPDNDGEVTAID